MRNWTLALVCALAAAAAFAQAPATPAGPPAAPAGPPPTGPVVGSGNFFSPIVGDLDKAVAFYRDGSASRSGHACQCRHQSCAPRHVRAAGRATTLADRPAAGDAHRRGDRRDRRRPASKPLERRVQDSGAFMLIVFVRDVDATFARVKALGAPIVTKGGAPIGLPAGKPRFRVIVVKDPDGHFVEISRPISHPRRRRRRPPTSSPFASADGGGCRQGTGAVSRRTRHEGAQR